MGHSYTKNILVVYLKIKCTGGPVFLFAKSGYPTPGGKEIAQMPFLVILNIMCPILLHRARQEQMEHGI